MYFLLKMVIFQCHVSFHISQSQKICIYLVKLRHTGVVVKSKGNHLISGKSRVVKYLNLATYIWNPEDHCFEWKGFLKGSKDNQVPGIYIYIYIYTYIPTGILPRFMYTSQPKKKHQQNISSMSNGFVRRTFWSPWEQSFLGWCWLSETLGVGVCWLVCLFVYHSLTAIQSFLMYFFDFD